MTHDTTHGMERDDMTHDDMTQSDMSRCDMILDVGQVVTLDLTLDVLTGHDGWYDT